MSKFSLTRLRQAHNCISYLSVALIKFHDKIKEEFMHFKFLGVICS